MRDLQAWNVGSTSATLLSRDPLWFELMRCELRLRVLELQDSECSDKTAEDVRVIESPVAKIIDFLKRYDAGGRKKPKAAEARELLQVIENADDLWSPDLQAQLTGNPYDNNVTDYLVHATSVAPPSREPKKGLLRSYSMHSKFDLMQLVDAEHVDREPSFRKLLGVRYTTDVQDPEAHEYAMKVAAETTRPQDTLDQIGTDFTLDFISLGTARHESRVSLCAVVKQCIKSLGISHVLKSKEKLLQLLAFASRVEDGYMDQGYHCKIHAADVTHRLTCVLNHSGIAEGSKRNNSLSCELLAAVVAAVVHDFEHPQVGAGGWHLQPSYFGAVERLGMTPAQVSNGFMVSAEASMAVAFNFQAVAENHSLRASIALMSQTEYNFTSAWDDKYEVHKFKNAMIKNVLATDMSRHFELLAQFKTKVVRGDALNGKECREVWMDWDYNLRSLVLQVAMKAMTPPHTHKLVPQSPPGMATCSASVQGPVPLPEANGR